LLFLWVHKGRSSVGVSPVFLIRMISAFVGVAEVLAARRRTANRCVTRLCTSENLLSQGRQLWIVFCSLLTVAFITDALVRFTFYLWTRSAAGRDRSASYGRANRSPAHGKVLSSFLILANCVEFCTATISLLTGLATRICVRATRPDHLFGQTGPSCGVGKLADRGLRGECICASFHSPNATCAIVLLQLALPHHSGRVLP